MRASLRGPGLTLAASLVWLGCGASEDAGNAAAASPVELADQEDAVCGMLVREQSAPRAQVVHRDGSRFFFCSLGDLLVHASAPSPHGRAEALFVEVLRPDEDPRQSHLGAHAWLSADEAVYVVGVERPGVMGAPVLSYASEADAEQVAQSFPEARTLDFAGLQQWWRQRQQAR